MPDVIAELVGRLSYQVDDKGLKSFQGGMEKGKKSAKGFTKTAGAAATAIGSLAAAAVKAGAAFAVNLAVKSAKAGDEIAKSAKQFGVATKDLQRLRFAADRAGASTAAFDTGMRSLTKGMQDAAQKGTGPVADGLLALGLSLTDIQGMGLEDQFSVLAEQLKNVSDPAERAGIAMQLFGSRAGAQLKPLLDEGAKGIKGLGDEAERFGILNDEQLKASEDFVDSLANMKQATLAAGAGIASGLTPHMEAGINALADWIAENDEFIQQDLPNVLGQIAEATGEVLKFVVEAVASIDDFAKEVGDLADEFENEYGPAIDVATDATTGLADAWGSVQGAIAKGILELLEFVGVIDDAEASINRIKIGLGIDDAPRAAERGNVGFAGGADSENERARLATQTAREKQRATDIAASQRAGERFAGLLAGENAAAQLTGILEFQELRKVAANKRKKKKGGGKKDKGIDTSQAQALFGSDLGERAELLGSTDIALQKAFEASTKSLEEGASRIIALEAGFDRLRKLSGDERSFSFQPIAGLGGSSIGDVLADAVTGPTATSETAKSAVDGAQFVRIDNSFHAPTDIQITIEGSQVAGLPPDEVLELVEREVGERLDERNKVLYDRLQPQGPV